MWVVMPAGENVEGGCWNMGFERLREDEAAEDKDPSQERPTSYIRELVLTLEA